MSARSEAQKAASAAAGLACIDFATAWARARAMDGDDTRNFSAAGFIALADEPVTVVIAIGSRAVQLRTWAERTLGAVLEMGGDVG